MHHLLTGELYHNFTLIHMCHFPGWESVKTTGSSNEGFFLFVWVKVSLYSSGSHLCTPSAGIPGVSHHTLTFSDLLHSEAGRDASAVTHPEAVVQCVCTEMLKESS